MKVMAADTLFDIVDLSAVWVLADVYEYELPRLRWGRGATMTLSYWPGRSWTGRVTYVYPSVDATTRTIKVRLEFANPSESSSPRCSPRSSIEGIPRQALVVPDDVVLDSGDAKGRLRLGRARGSSSPREISVGDQADGFAEVTAGLAEGDVVARGANFLVDSESRLKPLSALGRPPPKAGHRRPAPDAAGSAAPPPAGHVH